MLANSALQADSIGKIIWMAVIVAVILLLLFLFFRLRYYLRFFLLAMTGRSRLREAMEQMRYQRNHEPPRSLQSYESLALPELRKDFPELNIEAMRGDLATLLERVFADTLKPGGRFPEQTVALAGNWWKTLRCGLAASDAVVRGGPVHRVVIKSYQARETECHLTWQAAFATYIDDELRQERVDLDFVYALGQGDHVRQLKCPSCGGPVERTGAKTCAYCGCALNAAWDLTWYLADIRSS